MKVYPCCKINLGLNVTRKREDGYHDLETVFYPIPLCDRLEANIVKGKPNTCTLRIDGNPIEGDVDKNLVVKAYRILANEFQLPHIEFCLTKQIPSQAGLGGGSADAAYTLNCINALCNLNLTTAQMERYAAKLGADCAFLITAQSAFATGIGDQLQSMEAEQLPLKGKYIAIVKPNVAISTAQAFSFIRPQQPTMCCKDIVLQPITSWKDRLDNDFEVSMFEIYPEIREVKERLYASGAVFAQMSGSGSAFFGIFENEPKGIENTFNGMFTYVCQL